MRIVDLDETTKPAFCSRLEDWPDDAARAAELGDRVDLREVDTSEHAAVAEWGLADAPFVDGKQVMTGPPISPERLRKIVRKRLARAS